MKTKWTVKCDEHLKTWCPKWSMMTTWCPNWRFVINLLSSSSSSQGNIIATSGVPSSGSASPELKNVYNIQADQPIRIQGDQQIRIQGSDQQFRIQPADQKIYATETLRIQGYKHVDVFCLFLGFLLVFCLFLGLFSVFWLFLCLLICHVYFCGSSV